jgi:sugar-specific transcriptional regulator TrmB
MKSQANHYLIEKLGFTPIEATVYLCLLSEHPQTGYKVSTTISKSRSSTYQALKSLENKHAIIRLEGTEYGEYIPVSIEHYMDQKEKEFRSQKEEIIEAFKDIVPETQQEYIYQITRTEQLYSTVQSMIQKAQSMILVDTDDAPLQIIQDWLNAKANENVNVMIETLGEKHDDNCFHINLKQITPKDTKWDADWLCLSVDGEQFLISLLNKDTGELIHAIWCGNPYISPWVYNGMLHEFSFRVLLQMIEEEDDKEELLKRITAFTNRFFQPVKGFQRLQEKLMN